MITNLSNVLMCYTTYSLAHILDLHDMSFSVAILLFFRDGLCCRNNSETTLVDDRQHFGEKNTFLVIIKYFEPLLIFYNSK